LEKKKKNPRRQIKCVAISCSGGAKRLREKQAPPVEDNKGRNAEREPARFQKVKAGE